MVGNTQMSRRRRLAIAVAQPECVACNVPANARTHAELVRRAEARVVVFPELSLTGYELDAPAVSLHDPALQPLVEACRETNATALVGAPTKDQTGARRLSLLAVEGSGARVAYDKVWLGGAEPDWFVPGSAPAVLEVDGWRLGLAICKDTGVPQHAAATAALGMDAYLAAVLEAEEDASVVETRAKRIAAAHGVWVAVASFAGSTGGGYSRAAGRSGIWRPDGVPVARADARPGALARAVLA